MAQPTSQPTSSSTKPQVSTSGSGSDSGNKIISTADGGKGESGKGGEMTIGVRRGGRGSSSLTRTEDPEPNNTLKFVAIGVMLILAIVAFIFLWPKIR